MVLTTARDCKVSALFDWMAFIVHGETPVQKAGMDFNNQSNCFSKSTQYSWQYLNEIATPDGQHVTSL